MTTTTELPANGLPPAPTLVARARDPIALAGITVKAVDQIGESAAHEIEEAATQLEKAAGEVAGNLRRLATAVRVIETIRTLQQRLAGKDGEPDDGPAPVIPLRGGAEQQ
jgi:hypothetical protein